MSDIDERVVQMRFDNQQFEKNARTSLSTLDKLKSALTFGKAAKDLAGFQKEANGFSLAGLGDAIGTVGDKFTAFEVVGLRVLSNIADSAYRTGVRLVKSLSVDNIAAGWKKYEDKTTSVATLISQGYDMSTVDEQLNRLNWFTDETSYNFTDMVSNISKFTATGKGLEESVNAMEGIATWASLSGQNASTASRAMYQLSQAMGAGVMRREDYRSIQNMSMDTQEFRQAALDAGVALGTLKKNADGTYKSIVKGVGKVESFNINQFANHLTEDAWFTSDVMMKVFSKYGSAVDQLYEYSEKNGVTASEAIEALGKNVDAFGLKAFKSAQEARTFTDVLDSVKDAVSTGWMTTFELIFGNYEEAKKLWTDLANELYDVFAEGGNARNELLEGWKEFGGRTKLVESFWSAWNGVRNILSFVKEAFNDVFPPATVQNLLDVTNTVHDLTKKFENLFKLPENHAEALKKGIFGEGGTENENNAIKATITRIANLQKTLHGVFAILDIAKQGVETFFKLGVRLVSALLPVGDSVLSMTGSFGEWAVNLRNTINETGFFTKVIEKVGPVIDKVGSVARTVFEYLATAVKKLFGLFKPIEQESEEASASIEEHWSPITAIVDILKKAFDRLKQVFEALKPIFGQVGKGLGSAWDTLHEKLMSFLTGDALKNGINIANGGIFGVLMLAMTNFVQSLKKTIPSGNIFEGFVKTITDNVKGLIEAIKGPAKEVDTSDSLIKIAGAIAILAGSLWVLSTIDTTKLVGAVAAIGALMFMLGKVAENMSKLTSASMFSSEKGGIFRKLFGTITGNKEMTNLESVSKSLLMIAGSIAILAGSVFALAKLDWGELIRGLVGVGALLAMVTVVAHVMSSMEGRLVKGAGSLILVGVAIAVLTSSVRKLAELDPDKMTNGLIGVGGLLLELIMFANLADSIKMGTGMALIGIAAAILIISKVVEKFAGMEMRSLEVGLSSVGLVLAAFAAFSQLVNPKGLLKSAVSMLVMGAALNVIAIAVRTMGNMDSDKIANGLGAMAGALVLLVAAASVLGSIKGTFKGAAAILVMAAAMVVLAGAFKIMESIQPDKLIYILLAFAGAFVILGVAGALLAPMAGGILLLSGALLLISSSILIAGIGLAALSAGIMTLAGTLVIAGPMIINGIVATAMAFVSAIATALPQLLSLGMQMVLNLLIGIYQYIPSIAIVAVMIILKFLLTIAQMLPVIIQTGIALAISFINGIANGIRDNADAVVGAVWNLLSSVAYLMLTLLQSIAEKIPFIGGKIADGLEGMKEKVKESYNAEEMAAIAEESMLGAAEGIDRSKGAVESATAGISDLSISGLMQNSSQFGDIGSDQVLDYIQPYLDGTVDAETAAAGLGQSAVDGVDKDSVNQGMHTAGAFGGDGLISGLNSKRTDVYWAARSLGSESVRGVRDGMEEKSPSKAFRQAGVFGDEGLIIGLNSLKDNVGKTAYGIGKTAVDNIAESINMMASVLNSDMDLNPTITPVLDLSNIQNGTNTLNGMFANTRSFALASANGVQFEQNRMAALMKIDAQTTNADVVAALGLLRGDVTALNDSMLNTQVVLDSGALVGATARQMDNALGRFKTLKGRGI